MYSDPNLFMKTLAEVANGLPDYDPRALPVDSARRIIADFISPVRAVEQVALRSALDRILGRDIVSPIDVPAHDNSAMDGYALHANSLGKDAASSLRVVGTALAGTPYTGPVGRGECVRVMTGAVMPPGCDMVVVQEIVTTEGDRVLIPAGQRPGQNRRRRGEDLRAGEAALTAGKLLRPAELGLLASLGVAEVSVRRRVRVAFFSTGDELRSIGENLDEGCVYDSNRYTIFGMLQRLGVDLIDMGVVRDQPEALEAAMRSACENADAIITSGGVSVGEADFTRDLMSRLGDVAFWTIAMKPGRPFAFGRIASNGASALLFGLPGNPVAVMVTFYALVRDALLRLGGASQSQRPTVPAICDNVIRKSPGRTEYQRGILHAGAEGWHVRVTGAQGSGILRSMSEANCLIVLPPERASVEAGQTVETWPFDGLV